MLIKYKIAFWIALANVVFGPMFLPTCRLFYFVPYLVICFYQMPRYAVLWHSLVCGMILDLLSSTPFFGFSSLNFCIVSCVLYGQTRNFFDDKHSTLPIMTFLFSFLSTLVFIVLALFSGKNYTLTAMWIATDLMIMPLADAMYALIVFSLPFKLIPKFGKFRIRTHS